MIAAALTLAMTSPTNTAADLCRTYAATDRDAFCDGYVMATVDQMETRWSAACIARIRRVGLAEGRRRLSRIWATDPIFGQAPLAWSVEGGLLKVGECNSATDPRR